MSNSKEKYKSFDQRVLEPTCPPSLFIYKVTEGLDKCFEKRRIGACEGPNLLSQLGDGPFVTEDGRDPLHIFWISDPDSGLCQAIPGNISEFFF